MIATFSFIDFLFVSIDFVVFCLCLIWFLRRHKKAVAQEMEQEYARSVRLHEYRDGLRSQVDDGHIQAAEQERMCQDLSSKLMIWKQHFDEQDEQERLSREVVLQRAQETYLKQMCFRQQELYQHAVAGRVVAQVRQQVKKKYSEPGNSENYNDACLRLLEQHKRSS